DTENLLRAAPEPNANSLVIGPDGTIYAIAGQKGQAFAGEGHAAAWEIPPGFTEIKEVPGFNAAAESDEWPFTVATPTVSQNAGGPKVALSADGGTLYWKENIELSEATTAGQVVVRGYNLATQASTVVYGGGSTAGQCKIETSGAGLAAGKGSNVVVFDYG